MKVFSRKCEENRKRFFYRSANFFQKKLKNTFHTLQLQRLARKWYILARKVTLTLVFIAPNIGWANRFFNHPQSRNRAALGHQERVLEKKSLLNKIQ